MKGSRREGRTAERTVEGRGTMSLSENGGSEGGTCHKMLQNFHLDCPISTNFFVKFGKNFHSSYIRHEIHKAWGMHSKQFYPEVRRRLYFFGGLRLNIELHSCWREAFRYAEEWNRYPGVRKDELQLENEIQ